MASDSKTIIETGKTLLDQFFEMNNELSEIPTAHALMHFNLFIDSNAEFEDILINPIDETIFREQPERKEEVMAERGLIESISSGEQIIRYMRCGVDSINHRSLVNKAIEFEEEVVPEIIQRLKTSLNDLFIEFACRILTKCNMDATGELLECYDEVRYPYAQANILIVLGFRADETLIPWLIEKHDELKRLYPDKSHSDGAYFALLEISNRYYSGTWKEKVKNYESIETQAR